MSLLTPPSGVLRTTIAGAGARARAVAPAVVATLLAALAAATPAAAAARTFAGISLTADGSGYVLMSDAGEAHALGLPYRGGPSGFSGRIVGVSATADGQGYAAVSSTGQVYAYGTVTHRGNPTGFTGEIAGISVTADGAGYVVASTAGQVYAYGVPYRGNAEGFTGRITGVSVTASGSGYDLVSSAGQVYAFNTRFHGNPAGFSGEIVSISSTADGSGYYAISSAGQVYAYGARYHANPTGFTGRIVGISAKADGSGYAALSSSGQVYAYGTAYLGNGDPGTTPPSGTSPAPAGARAAIVAIARREAANPARNRERGAANCNFYTGALNAGRSAGCEGDFRSQAWCADFGRWLWREAGVRTTGLTAAARSFETYGRRMGTWRGGASLGGVQLGDAVVLTRTGGGHVAFVTAVNADGSVETISGNASDRVKRVVYRPGHASLLGVTSPAT